MKYGKLIDGQLIPAPIEIYKNGKVVELKTHKDYMQNGYKVVVNKKPKYDESLYEIYLVGFSETESIITVEYELREKSISNSDEILEEFIKIYNEEINNNGNNK